MGLCNYYHRHIQKIAEITASFCEAVISGGPKSTNRKLLRLNETQFKSQIDTLDVLSNATTLAIEDHVKQLVVHSYASDSHVREFLEQDSKNGKKCLLAFFLKTASSKSCQIDNFLRTACVILKFKTFPKSYYRTKIVC